MRPDGGNSMTETKEKRSLATNAVFNTFYRMLDIIFPLISSGYVARMLTPEGVGRYAAAANNVSYFVLLGSLGIQAYAIRETAKRRDDKKARDKLFSEMLVVNAVLTMAAIFIFISFADSRSSLISSMSTGTSRGLKNSSSSRSVRLSSNCLDLSL